MRIAEADREVVVAEALAVADELPPGEARVEFQELADAAEQGEVPGDLAGRLGEVAALALETGRARSVHGPGGVRTLTGVWRETPQGRAVTTEVEELNAALGAVRGHPIDAVRVAVTAPGAYSVVIAAGPYELRVALDRGGATLRSVNVGGGGTGE
jgi:hypothetical protein